MSELTKYLVHNYNNMSKKSKSETGLTYNPAYLDGYRQCVVDAQSFEDEQPTLNENQQIVLDYLKDKCNVCSFISHKPFEAILRLSMLDPEKTELRVINTIDELTYKQQAQVIEVFSKWAQEQAEE